MSIVTIIASGAMGSALSFPLRANGHEVRLVGSPLDRDIIRRLREDGWHTGLNRKLPEGIRPFQIEELSAALEGADLIISGVSSFGVDWFVEEMFPVLPDDVPILSVTKGLMDLPDGSMITYPALYEERAPQKTFFAIGGPCTSYELADLDQTHVTFCGRDMEALRRIKAILQTSWYHISLSTDVTGVECAVAMKNAYALGVTLAVGLSQRLGEVEHYNSQAALFGQSVREMRRLLALVGGQDDKIMLGAGDLYVTIFGGRTRKIGTLLGRGMSFEEAMAELSGVTLESIVISTRTARAVRRRIAAGEASASDFPLMLHIDDIINSGAEVDIPWDAFATEEIL